MRGKDIKMSFRFIIFSLIALGIYLSVNYYIGMRTFERISHLTKVSGLCFWLLFWIVSLSYIIARVSENHVSPQVVNIFEYIGVYYMGIMFYLLLFFAAMDTLRYLNNKIKFIPDFITGYKNFNIIISLLMLIMISTVLIKGYYNASHTIIKEYSVDINKKSSLGKSINIVMVSDIHLGSIIENKRLRNMVSEINSLNPHIVILAGDIVDSTIKPFLEKKMAEEFKNIKSKYGTFAVLGNHDIMMGMDEQITEELEKKAGVQVLRDRALLIGNGLYIAGRDDASINRSGIKRKALKDILDKANINLPIILIDHTPKDIDEAHKENIDLMLSGHTHKGQLYPNSLITSRIYEIDYGHLNKNHFNIIVSSGYGTWGPPMRIGSQSEVVNIKLNFNN